MCFTFDVLGFIFGTSGDAAYRYVDSLFDVLVKTLKELEVLPDTQFKTPEELKMAFKNFETLLIDATERVVQKLKGV